MSGYDRLRVMNSHRSNGSAGSAKQVNNPPKRPIMPMPMPIPRPSLSAASTSSALPPALTGPFFNCSGVYMFDSHSVPFRPFPAFLHPLMPYLSSFPLIVPSLPTTSSSLSDSLIPSNSPESIDLYQTRHHFYVNSLKFALDRKFRISFIESFSIPIRSHVTEKYIQLELELITEDAYDLNSGSSGLTNSGGGGSSNAEFKAAYVVITLSHPEHANAKGNATDTAIPADSLVSSICVYDHSLLPHSFPPPQPDYLAHPNLRFHCKRVFKRVHGAEPLPRPEEAAESSAPEAASGAESESSDSGASTAAKLRSPIADLIIAHAKARQQAADEVREEEMLREKAMEGNRMRSVSFGRRGDNESAAAVEGIAGPSHRRDLSAVLAAAGPASIGSAAGPLSLAATQPASWSMDSSNSSLAVGLSSSVSSRSSLVGGPALSMASAILSAGLTAPVPASRQASDSALSTSSSSSLSGSVQSPTSTSSLSSPHDTPASIALSQLHITGVWRLNRSQSSAQDALYAALEVPLVTRKFLEKLDIMLEIAVSAEGKVEFSEHFSLTDHTGLCHQSFPPQKVALTFEKEKERRDETPGICCWLEGKHLISHILQGDSDSAGYQIHDQKHVSHDRKSLKQTIAVWKSGVELGKVERVYEVMPDEDEDSGAAEGEFLGDLDSQSESEFSQELTMSEVEEDALDREEEAAHAEILFSAAPSRIPNFSGHWSVDKTRSNDLNKFARLLNLSFMTRQSITGGDHTTLIVQNGKELVITEKSTLNDVTTHFPLPNSSSSNGPETFSAWFPLEYLGKEGQGRVKFDKDNQQFAVEFLYWTDKRKIGKKITQFATKMLKKDEEKEKDKEKEPSGANGKEKEKEREKMERSASDLDGLESDSPPLHSAPAPALPSSGSSSSLPPVPDGFLLSRVSDIRQLVNRTTMRQVLTYSENDIILCIVNRYFIKKENDEERQLAEMAAMRDRIQEEKLRKEMELWEKERKKRREEKRKIRREKRNKAKERDNGASEGGTQETQEGESQTQTQAQAEKENEGENSGAEKKGGMRGSMSLPYLPMIPAGSANSPAVTVLDTKSSLKLPMLSEYTTKSQALFTVPKLRYPDAMGAQQWIDDIPFFKWLNEADAATRRMYWALSCVVPAIIQIGLSNSNTFFILVLALFCLVGVFSRRSGVDSWKKTLERAWTPAEFQSSLSPFSIEYLTSLFNGSDSTGPGTGPNPVNLAKKMD